MQFEFLSLSECKNTLNGHWSDWEVLIIAHNIIKKSLIDTLAQLSEEFKEFKMTCTKFVINDTSSILKINFSKLLNCNKMWNNLFINKLTYFESPEKPD